MKSLTGYLGLLRERLHCYTGYQTYWDDWLNSLVTFSTSVPLPFDSDHSLLVFGQLFVPSSAIFVELEELLSGYLKYLILELAPAEFYIRRHSGLMPCAHIVCLFLANRF